MIGPWEAAPVFCSLSEERLCAVKVREEQSRRAALATGMAPAQRSHRTRVQPRPRWGQVRRHVHTRLTDPHVVPRHSQDPLLLRASSVSPQCTAQTLPRGPSLPPT